MRIHGEQAMNRFIFSLVVLLAAAVLILPGSAQGQEWRHVAVVASDASAGETSLTVEFLGSCQEGRKILLENRDGSYREEVLVQHIYGWHIILEKPLKQAFSSGSRVYQ